jgi:hypothetical protein
MDEWKKQTDEKSKVLDASEEEDWGGDWGLGSIKDITLCNKLIRVVYVLGPEWSELWKCNVKPWLSLPIIVDDSSLFCGC